MAKAFIFMMCPVGIAVALLRRYAWAGPAARGDVPERLLRWAVGLLSARRAEWGQAMLGELDHIEGRGRRWRFAAGCAGAALLLPPWGRAAAAVWAMVVAAAGAAGVYAAVAVRYRLGAGDWVFAVIVLVFLVSFTLAAATLLRRPGVAVPGLLGGLLVALTWLALSGFSFYGLDRQLHRQRPARQQRDQTPGGCPAGDRDDRMGRRRGHRPHPPAPGHQRGFSAVHGGRPSR